MNRVALVVAQVDMKAIHQAIGAGQSLVDCIVLVIRGIESEEIEYQGKSSTRWHVVVAFQDISIRGCGCVVWRSVFLILVAKAWRVGSLYK